MSTIEDVQKFSHDLRSYYSVINCAVYFLEDTCVDSNGSEYEEMLSRNLNAVRQALSKLIVFRTDVNALIYLEEDLVDLVSLLQSVQTKISEKGQNDVRQQIDETLQTALSVVSAVQSSLQLLKQRRRHQSG